MQLNSIGSGDTAPHFQMDRDTHIPNDTINDIIITFLGDNKIINVLQYEIVEL